MLTSAVRRGTMALPANVCASFRQAVLATDRGLIRASLTCNPKSIYDRVSDEPEQSYERAAAEIPPLNPTKTAPFVFSRAARFADPC